MLKPIYSSAASIGPQENNEGDQPKFTMMSSKDKCSLSGSRWYFIDERINTDDYIYTQERRTLSQVFKGEEGTRSYNARSTGIMTEAYNCADTLQTSLKAIERHDNSWDIIEYRDVFDPDYDEHIEKCTLLLSSVSGENVDTVFEEFEDMRQAKLQSEREMRSRDLHARRTGRSFIDFLL
jgi:hypothetical protein